MKTIQKRKNAFTLIELLVVISLIAALVGILAVAQKKVKLVARNLRQKAEFHGMEISLELFYSDFNFYPDSEVVEDGGTQVCGAQRLAEAMIGRDEQGFHPKSKWHPDLDSAALPPHPGAAIYTDATLKDRKPLYFELKHTDFYTVDDLWNGSTGSSVIYDSATAATPTEKASFFTDVFTFNKVQIGSKSIKVGSPVLYFKADSTKKFRVDATNTVVNNPTSADYEEWVYNLDDNTDILNLPWLRELPDAIAGDTTHYTADPDNPSVVPEAGAGTMEPEYFYKLLTQREDTTNGRAFFKPYNPSTFILISAGWDGRYGTEDDITSFDY